MNAKSSLIFIGLFLCLAASPAVAVDKPSAAAAAKQALTQQKQQLISEKKEKIEAAKCANIEQKIQSRISKFNAGKVRRISAFNNMKRRLTVLEVKLAAKGYDTSKLKADLAVLNSKIDKFLTDYAANNAALSETKKFACGKSEGEFRAQLLESKDLLATVHADSKDIKEYYANTVKPDLQEIKKQTPTTKQSNGTGASN